MGNGCKDIKKKYYTKLTEDIQRRTKIIANRQAIAT